MNSGHRDYPGSGHPEVNSPTSCFDCIISLSWWSFTTPLSLAWPTERCSSVAHSGWKKNRDKLHSILLSSGVLPLHRALRASFIGEEKLAGEALRSARGSSGNLADSPLVKGNAPCSEVPACPLQALTGSAWRAACLVHLFTCLCSEQAKCGTARAMIARLGSLRTPSGEVSAWSSSIKCCPRFAWCCLTILNVRSVFIGKPRGCALTGGTASLGKSATRRVPRGASDGGSPRDPLPGAPSASGGVLGEPAGAPPGCTECPREVSWVSRRVPPGEPAGAPSAPVRAGGCLRVR